MEKAFGREDRIKRAEEIYYRRKRDINPRRTVTVDLNSKKEYKLFKKTGIQILICILIYFIINGMTINTDSFCVDSVEYIKKTMAYDADIVKWFNYAKNYLIVMYNKNTDYKEKPEDIVDKETQNNIENEISGQQVNEITENPNMVEEEISISQMEQDAKYIKEKFSLIKPVDGTITSRFGIRNPTTATVPVYHTGIDIGVGEGTKFVAAMDGKVELVSSEGDYRKSY